jgi:hypothetical protein
MHLAVVGKAKVLVSGDRELLALAQSFEKTCGCLIVNLNTFIRVQMLPAEECTPARVKEFDVAETRLARLMKTRKSSDKN